MDHDWHLFDELQQLETARIDGDQYVRKVGGSKVIAVTEYEWEQVREPGPDPDVMARLSQ